MNRFRFRLQAVLILRQRQEQLAMERYAAALAECARAQERFHQAKVSCLGVAAAHGELLRRGATAAEVIQSHQHHQLWEERLVEQSAAVQRAQSGVDDALQSMLAVRAQRETVDKFQDRQRRFYEIEARRQEQKLLDEWAQRPKPAALRLSLTSKDLS